MHHQQGLAPAFIQVMVIVAPYFEVMGPERVKASERGRINGRAYHSTPSMKQFSPLPIPRNPT